MVLIVIIIGVIIFFAFRGIHDDEDKRWHRTRRKDLIDYLKELGRGEGPPPL